MKRSWIIIVVWIIAGAGAIGTGRELLYNLWYLLTALIVFCYVWAWTSIRWVDVHNWRRLRGDLGIEIDDPARLEPREMQGTCVYFVVRGDGKELYRSPTLRWNARGPVRMDVNVSGVRMLELEVANEATWHNAASSVNWGDLRLEK